MRNDWQLANSAEDQTLFHDVGTKEHYCDNRTQVFSIFALNEDSEDEDEDENAGETETSRTIHSKCICTAHGGQIGNQSKIKKTFEEKDK